MLKGAAPICYVKYQFKLKLLFTLKREKKTFRWKVERAGAPRLNLVTRSNGVLRKSGVVVVVVVGREEGVPGGGGGGVLSGSFRSQRASDGLESSLVTRTTNGSTA